ncbi:MAG TPA: TIGR00730 family Rossman fold protein, partial [Flavobacteriales bacterium]|nr:TIGR00730 family Rossman fold protein [Flavobacteriales bacterium]
MKRIAIFCGASLGFNPIYAQQAAALGRFLAEQQVEIVYGGGKFGMMGAIADAALAAGGKVIGVIPEFLKTEEIAHKGIHDMVTTQQMSTRKVAISKMVDGYIALAGGYGT